MPWPRRPFNDPPSRLFGNANKYVRLIKTPESGRCGLHLDCDDVLVRSFAKKISHFDDKQTTTYLGTYIHILTCYVERDVNGEGNVDTSELKYHGEKCLRGSLSLSHCEER